MHLINNLPEMGELLSYRCLKILKSAGSLLCCFFMIGYIHAGNPCTSSAEQNPVITLKGGAILYSADPLFYNIITASIDSTGSTLEFISDGIYKKTTAGCRKAVIKETQYKISRTHVRQSCGPAHLRKPDMVAGSADTSMSYRSANESMFCMISSGSASKMYRTPELYKPEHAISFQEPPHEHKLHHTIPLLSFLSKLQIPRGPPGI